MIPTIILILSKEEFEDNKGVIRRTNNIMANRKRTDNIMAKRRRTNNIMAKRKRTKGQTTIYKTYT